ncbi:MAG: hypothetical protein Q7V58_09540 [Actinomycetota bacterium]|nr:hypothetical protein [Actinomycetota bacterium]
MAWVTIDDQFPEHRKVAGLTDAAFRLHFCGIAYCSRQLTDGLIETDAIPTLVRKYRPAALAELVERGLWKPIAIGEGKPAVYEIHDYLQWNQPREVVLARKEKAAKRAKESREKRNA